MVNASIARILMPGVYNTDNTPNDLNLIMMSIEKGIISNARLGKTKKSFVLYHHSFRLRGKIKEILIQEGYSISGESHGLTVSWKQL